MLTVASISFSIIIAPSVCPFAGIVFGVLDILALQVLQYTTSLYFPSAVHVAGTSSSFTASPGVCPFALSVFFVLDISALQVLHLTTSS